jgi:DNA invertase Pin-like site-specific DNA recombinase
MIASASLLEELTGGRMEIGTAEATAPVKAFAWARVSTSMQEERGLSIPEQLREIREYAEARNIEIVGEFSEAESAFQQRAKRPEFERMLAKARTERISMILVHDLSRFSRDSVGGKAIVRQLRGQGIKVVSLNDPELDPDTVAGVYLEAITFAKNEAYSREVAFHTRKGCRANVQTRDPESGWCYKNGGQPLWGYRSLRLERGQDKRGRPIIKSIWVLDDTVIAGCPAHEWARHCLIELAAGGASLAELRDFCNRKGIPVVAKPFGAYRRGTPCFSRASFCSSAGTESGTHGPRKGASVRRQSGCSFLMLTPH